MRRGLLLAALSLAGLMLGAAATFTAQHVAAGTPSDQAPRQPGWLPAAAPSTADADADPPLPSAPPVAPAERLLLAWAPAGLPAGFAEVVAALTVVDAVTEVRGDLLELSSSSDADGAPVDELENGWVIPLDAVAVDVGSYLPFVPKSAYGAFSELEDGAALLSRTSAALRRIGAGGSVTLSGGRQLRVAAVVDDELIGGAEIALTAGDGERLGARTPRYLLLTYQGERAAVEDAVRAAAPAGTILRVRAPGETPYLRHGDAVLPQAAIKERFGEFSYRRGGGIEIVQDPEWVAEHIVAARVPILGEVRCHRALIPALEAALEDLAARKLGHVVDVDGYAGCWVPRLIASEQGLSRHAWGAALDLNWPKNPVGQESAQDPQLVEIMDRWGFAWGGHWLIPDPAHFEYARPAAPAR